MQYFCIFCTYLLFLHTQGPSFLATVTLYKVENITVTASVVQPTPTLIQVTSSPIASLSANISSTASSVLSPSPTAIPSVTPNVTVNTTTRTIVTLATYNDSLLVNATLLQPIICLTSTGVKGSCDFNTPPKPTYDFTTNTCKNVVLKVSGLLFFVKKYLKILLRFWPTTFRVEISNRSDEFLCKHQAIQF